MDHVAIMKKSWHLIPKILSGEKTIESRWYLTRRDPWDKIIEGDTVYFKNSGESVTVKTTVSKVIQFKNIKPQRIRQIVDDYGEKICLSDKEQSKQNFSQTKYCLLIFLRNVQQVLPFEIDKTGFGMMSAWLSVTNINQIRKKMI